MRGDSSGRNRSALLTRWRGALRLVPEPLSVALEPVVASEPTAATAAPAIEPTFAPALADEAALFSSFEAELRRAVAQPTAERLLALLEPSRRAVLAERTAASCATCLAQLDLLEDVLDALLLVNHGGDAEPGTAPR